MSQTSRGVFCTCSLLPSWIGFIDYRHEKTIKKEKCRFRCFIACSVDVTYIRAQKITWMFVCMHVTYRTNKWFLNFVGLMYVYFFILAYPLFTVRFIQTFFSQIQKNRPLKYLQSSIKVLAQALFQLCF